MSWRQASSRQQIWLTRPVDSSLISSLCQWFIFSLFQMTTVDYLWFFSAFEHLSLWLYCYLILIIDKIFLHPLYSFIILGNSFASRVISGGSGPPNTPPTVPGGQRGPEQALLQVILAQAQLLRLSADGAPAVAKCLATQFSWIIKQSLLSLRVYKASRQLCFSCSVVDYMKCFVSCRVSAFTNSK